MIRVFIAPEAVSGGVLRLTGADARHVGGALRMRVGEPLVAVTPDGIEHRCTVTAASASEVLAEVIETGPSRSEPRLRVRLGQALLKGDQFDRILESSAEVGVDSVQPLLTERAIARLDPGKAAAKLDRWRQIVRQGAELGQRARLPEVLDPASLAEAVGRAAADGMRSFLLYEGISLPSLSHVDYDSEGGVALMVGPEGGWSEAEVRLAEQAGALPVTLGPRIMRPLPAALTALAVVLHRAGELELKEE
ncbi:MAG: 16S rRNA (uracil(1498)-N(3))-methyltransferase [Candidatus Dormibacteraeota bacterium]|nr:16S rRNA (uracil(1498)-N(3))-methyltransferase [Candidatus Dormibacteraeota bacterium]